MRTERQEYFREYRQRNKESLRAKGRAYYAVNRERIRARDEANRVADAERRKARYEANREILKAKQRAYHAANREVLNAKTKARARRYYEANRDAILARQRELRRINKDRFAERSRAYYEAHKERYSQRDKAWRRANPDKTAVIYNRRRARMQGAEPDLTARQWRAILTEFDGHCAYCDRDDVPLTQEHMTPLTRGGRHTASNVVPACRPCNSRKHTKTTLEFAGWTIPPRRDAQKELADD